MNAEKFEIGELADRLAQGYLAFHVAIRIGTNPDAKQLLPIRQPGQLVPTGEIPSEDGSRQITYHAEHYFFLACQPAASREYSVTWMSGALISLGDALSRHGYFDRQPEYELIRHLRNAVAHGNCFRIDSPHLLDDRPAYWPGRNDDGTSDHSKRRFEVKPELHTAKCLFSFIGEADLVGLLQATGHRLRFDATHSAI